MKLSPKALETVKGQCKRTSKTLLVSVLDAFTTTSCLRYQPKSKSRRSIICGIFCRTRAPTRKMTPALTPALTLAPILSAPSKDPCVHRHQYFSRTPSLRRRGKEATVEPWPSVCMNIFKTLTRSHVNQPSDGSGSSGEILRTVRVVLSLHKRKSRQIRNTSSLAHVW